MKAYGRYGVLGSVPTSAPGDHYLTYVLKMTTNKELIHLSKHRLRWSLIKESFFITALCLAQLLEISTLLHSFIKIILHMYFNLLNY